MKWYIAAARGRLFFVAERIKRLLPLGLTHDFRKPDLVGVFGLHNRFLGPAVVF